MHSKTPVTDCASTCSLVRQHTNLFLLKAVGFHVRFSVVDFDFLLNVLVNC